MCKDREGIGRSGWAQCGRKRRWWELRKLAHLAVFLPVSELAGLD